MSVTTAPAVRPAELLYSVDEWPPPARLVLLGLQYAIMDAIFLVLVAIIVRTANVGPAESVNIMGIACLALAIGTVLQALPRGPVGSGFLAPPVYSAAFLAPSVLAAKIGGMPLVYGMTLLAGLMEVMLALMLIRLRAIITPVLSGLSVFIIGLQLGVVGIGQVLDVQHETLPSYHLHLLVTVFTLSVPIGLSIWGRGTVKLLCSFLGLLAGMAAAFPVHLLQPAALAAFDAAEWFAIPTPTLPAAFQHFLAARFPGRRHCGRAARHRRCYHVPADQ
jgi:xanthine permease XanP